MIAELGVTQFVLFVIIFVTSGFLLYGAWVSVLEKEKRAAIRSFLSAMAIALVFFSPLIIPSPYNLIIADLLIGLFIAIAIILVFPTRIFEKKIEQKVVDKQINEKTVMFSRKQYEPGSDRYKDYYKNFPDHENMDNKFRSKPGLLSDKASHYDPFTFTASNAIFESIMAFHPIVEEEPAVDKKEQDPNKLREFIIEWLKKEGAVSVGFTETKHYHWYSEVGRGKDFGKKAQLPHSHAIAFTVEMDKELLDTAPQGPAVMESARQYMKAAVIANELAMFLRKLGFHARAHIDGNYRVVCPLVAKDAGLGEIGRMGILMTPELGPRVRIGVVTTDLSLPDTGKKDLSHMIKFCRICKKCADVCPSNAISFEDREEIDGVKRWQIQQEACFTLWCIVGTDCGKCMSDCPYSHPDNLFHNVIRAMIKNSLIFRYAALKMDDFYYGRKPKSADVPEWLRSK